MSIIFLQQIISSMLLWVVIGEQKSNFIGKFKYIYIYIYKTEAFEAPTIFHVSTIFFFFLFYVLLKLLSFSTIDKI